MKKTFLLVLFGLFAAGYSWGQTKVTGTVTASDDGKPISFASVVVKGTSTAVTTDSEGKYSINVPAGSNTLVYSFMGYISVEENIAGRSVINVTLSSDNVLDESIVTAFGSSTKKGFTGAASVVKSESIKDLQVSNISQALQGQASGVRIMGSSGQPGEAPTINVRGVGSVSAGQTPLIVVDGVQFDGNISTINPNDIESATILKDASSTALYGSRAANGVLVITTKQGRSGDAQINFNAVYGVSSRARKDYAMLSAADYLKVAWEGARNYYQQNYRLSLEDANQEATDYFLLDFLGYNPTDSDTPIGIDGKLNANMLWDQDWADALLRTGKRGEYTLDVSGGSDNVRYLVSGGYLSDEGIVQTSKFERYTVRGKIDANPRRWMKLGLNTTTSYSSQNFPNQSGTAYSNVIGFIRTLPNIYPAYERNLDGSIARDEQGNAIPDLGMGTGMFNPYTNVREDRPTAVGQNPLATTKLNELEYNRMLIGNNAYATITFLEGLQFHSQLSVDWYELQGKTFYNPLIGDGVSYRGMSQRERTNTTTMSFINNLTYDFRVKDDHHFNLLLGTVAYDMSREYLYAAARGFSTDKYSELVYGTNPSAPESTRTGVRSYNIISRVNYDFLNRYFLTASYTRDGVSRFHKNVRFESFYSIGAAWLITGEEFMASTANWLDLLKLKLSYGTTGNSFITSTGEGYAPYLAVNQVGRNILGIPGSTIASLGNPKLSWESQKQLDLGVEFSFLSGLISGGFTYFNKDNEDLLFARPLPLSGGQYSYPANTGSVNNKGIELDLTGVIIKNKDFDLTVSLNLASIKNKVVSLPDEYKVLGLEASGNKILKEGYNMYTFYLREYAGVDPKTGDALWYKDITDANGNVTGRETTNSYSSATRYTNEVAWPDFYGGFQTHFRYRDFDLNIAATYSVGGKILDLDKARLMHNFNSNAFGNQASADYMSNAVWRAPGDEGKTIPKLNGPNVSDFGSASTNWLVDATYLRINNITLGYNIRSKFLENNIGFRGARVFVSGENLITLFKAEGVDPERGMGSVATNNTSSALKTISFGLNLHF